MGDVIHFELRRRPQAPETRYRIEGALALALDAVDQLVAVLDQLDDHWPPKPPARDSGAAIFAFGTATPLRAPAERLSDDDGERHLLLAPDPLR